MLAMNREITPEILTVILTWSLHLGIFRSLTSVFSVELPGIEPGSYGIPSRLLRAQSAMPLLGSPEHANKSG